MSKIEFEIVELRVEYTIEDILQLNKHRDTVVLHHRGSIGDWKYHSKDQATLLGTTIPINRITLTNSYDVQNIIQPSKFE